MHPQPGPGPDRRGSIASDVDAAILVSDVDADILHSHLQLDHAVHRRVAVEDAIDRRGYDADGEVVQGVQSQSGGDHRAARDASEERERLHRRS